MRTRCEQPGDEDAIRTIVTSAFGQPDEAGLVDALRASGDGVISLVAEVDGAAVGHILFSRLQSPERCLALAPVAVAPDRQGQGIGGALIHAGIDRARAGGWRGIFVLGEPEYYTRFGFSVATAAPFETDYPRGYFMALELAEGSLGVGGAVDYAAAFQEL